MADKLSARFAHLRSEIEESAVLPLAADIRERGRRRRFAGILGTVTAFLAAGVAVLAAAMLVTAPTGGPFGPSASGSWSGVTPSFYRQSPQGGPPRGTRTTLPPGLVMFYDGTTGWQRYDSRDRPAALSVCGGPDRSTEGRTDARTLVGPGYRHPLASPPANQITRVTHQVFMYGTDAAAAAAYDNLLAGATGCGWTRRTEMADGDGRFEFGGRSGTPDSQGFRAHAFAILRERNAVFVIYAEVGGDRDMAASEAAYQTDWQAVFWAVGPLCQAGVLCLPDFTATGGPTLSPS